MVIKVKANPTFTWEITIPSPDGDFKATLEYRHMTVTDYAAFWTEARKRQAEHVAAVDAAKTAGLPEPKPERSALDDVMAIVVGWQDFDTPFSREAMSDFLENHHLSETPIYSGWVEGLRTGKQKN